MEKKTILLVENEGMLRCLIKGALEDRYNVLQAANCHEAIGQVNCPIDLALIDYLLPDGDGFAVLAALREAKPGLPVIMMTAYSTEDLAIQALRSGVTDYLKKPFTLAYLTGRLSEILEGRRNGELPEGEANRQALIMDCIAAIIDNNFKKNLTRDALAKRANMDKYTFSKVFKARFGQGLKSYINSVRTKKAAELLGKNELTVKEVIFSVGYKSTTHFCRVFREIYELSPTEYREQQARSSSTA